MSVYVCMCVRVGQSEVKVLRFRRGVVPLVGDAQRNSHAKYQLIWLKTGLSLAGLSLHGNSYGNSLLFLKSFLQVVRQHEFTRNKDRLVGYGPMNKLSKKARHSMQSPRCALDRRPVSSESSILP